MNIARVGKQMKSKSAWHRNMRVAQCNTLSQSESSCLHRFTLFALLATLLMLSCNGFSQTGGGQITGDVTDSSTAAVAGAQVTATNEKTGSQYSAVTSSAGEFHFPTLQVGSYTVTVTAQGFKVEKRTGIL